MMERHGGDWAGYETEYGSLPLDFSANVSPLGLPDGVREAAVQALEDAARYPDPLCRALRSRLAQRHGIPAERIVCGNGAADLIFRICRMLRPKKALLTAPDFGEYEQALREENCTTRTVTRQENEGFLLRPEELAEGIRGADLLFLQRMSEAFLFDLRQLPCIRLRRNNFDFVVHNLARYQWASAQVRAAFASTSSGTEKVTGIPATGGGVIRSISSFRSCLTRSASPSGHSTISSS